MAKQKYYTTRLSQKERQREPHNIQGNLFGILQNISNIANETYNYKKTLKRKNIKDAFIFVYSGCISKKNTRPMPLFGICENSLHVIWPETTVISYFFLRE